MMYMHLFFFFFLSHIFVLINLLSLVVLKLLLLKLLLLLSGHMISCLHAHKIINFDWPVIRWGHRRGRHATATGGFGYGVKGPVT